MRCARGIREAQQRYGTRLHGKLYRDLTCCGLNLEGCAEASLSKPLKKRASRLPPPPPLIMATAAEASREGGTSSKRGSRELPRTEYVSVDE